MRRRGGLRSRGTALVRRRATINPTDTLPCLLESAAEESFDPEGDVGDAVEWICCGDGNGEGLRSTQATWSSSWRPDENFARVWWMESAVILKPTGSDDGGGRATTSFCVFRRKQPWDVNVRCQYRRLATRVGKILWYLRRRWMQ